MNMQSDRSKLMKQYKVKNVNDKILTYDNALWNSVPIAEINHFAWDKDYQPYAIAQLVYTSTALHLRMEALEPFQNMRITATGVSNEVYKDSCLEFFLMPSPASDDRYINFEINPAGAALVGIGSDRYKRLLISEYALKECNISAFIQNMDDSLVKWGYTLSIPFHFIQKYFNDFNLNSQKILRCNFYKCGDSTLIPHYGSWNPIVTDHPDFHQSVFFGDLICD